jgi:hypothetical protein
MKKISINKLSERIAIGSDKNYSAAKYLASTYFNCASPLTVSPTQTTQDGKALYDAIVILRNNAFDLRSFLLYVWKNEEGAIDPTYFYALPIFLLFVGLRNAFRILSK